MIDPESWLNTLCENDQVPTQVTNIKNSMFNTVRSRIGIKTSETAAKRYGVATLYMVRRCHFVGSFQLSVSDAR